MRSRWRSRHPARATPPAATIDPPCSATVRCLLPRTASEIWSRSLPVHSVPHLHLPCFCDLGLSWEPPGKQSQLIVRTLAIYMVSSTWTCKQRLAAAIDVRLERGYRNYGQIGSGLVKSCVSGHIDHYGAPHGRTSLDCAHVMMTMEQSLMFISTLGSKPQMKRPHWVMLRPYPKPPLKPFDVASLSLRVSTTAISSYSARIPDVHHKLSCPLS